MPGRNRRLAHRSTMARSFAVRGGSRAYQYAWPRVTAHDVRPRSGRRPLVRQQRTLGKTASLRYRRVWGASAVYGLTRTAHCPARDGEREIYRDVDGQPDARCGGAVEESGRAGRGLPR